jgi:hypothetical protein
MIQNVNSRAATSKHFKVILANVLLPLLVAGCIVPLITPPSVSTANPNILSTIISGTAQAASTQTAVALSPTSSPSPIPTETLTPTVTVTPGAVFSTEGTILIPDENGSTVFIDQSLGYRLRVPSGWLLVRINEPEITDAFNRPEAADARMLNFLTQVQKNDPKTFRLFGADPLSDHFLNGFVTNFNVFWDPASAGSLEQVIAMLKDQLPRSELNSSITHAAVSFTSSRVPMGVVESSATLLSTAGWPVNLYQKQVVFHIKTGALTVVLSTTHEQKNTYLPGFDAMVDQVVLLEQ